MKSDNVKKGVERAPHRSINNYCFYVDYRPYEMIL